MEPFLYFRAPHTSHQAHSLEERSRREEESDDSNSYPYMEMSAFPRWSLTPGRVCPEAGEPLEEVRMGKGDLTLGRGLDHLDSSPFKLEFNSPVGQSDRVILPMVRLPRERRESSPKAKPSSFLANDLHKVIPRYLSSSLLSI